MLLKELFLKEDDRSTAVFAFGRFNPPTIGHAQLINKVQSMAKQVNGMGYIFLSHSQNNKKIHCRLKKNNLIFLVKLMIVEKKRKIIRLI